MANGNRGIGGFLPFPTFGGGKESGGVTPVKLAPTQMRFPTAGRFARRAPEPELKETIAPFLPIAVEGIMNLIKGRPETMTDAQYLDSIGGLSGGTDLDDVLGDKQKMAQLQTYKQFGEPEKKDTFGGDEIINMIIGSQMGRGAKEYAATSRAIDAQKEKSRLTTATNRAAFTKEALKDINNLQYKTFEDVDKARLGINDYRSGFVDPRGDVYVMKDDKSGYANIKELEGNWIEQKYKPTASLSSQLKDPRLVDLSKKDGELNAKDTALLGTMTLTNEMVRMLDKGIADPKQNPLTTVTAIGNFLNSATSNANQVLSYVGGGDVMRAFATADDIQNNVAGSNGREGSGQLAKQLYQAIQSGDDEQMLAAMEAFEKGNPEVSFRASLGDAQTAKDNILGFVDTLVRQTDNVIQGTISLNNIQAGRYDLGDQMFTSILAGYWQPPVVDGTPDFTNTQNYEFKNFYTRYSRVPDVVSYQKHQRRAGTEFNPNQGTTAVNPTTQLEEDLKAIELLY